MSHTSEQYIKLLEDYIIDQSGLDVRKHENAGMFRYVPLRIDQFIEQLNIVSGFKDLPNEPKFVDVGCGIGQKLAILGWIYYRYKIYGIEYSKEYAKIAKALVPKTTQIIIADAITQNYKIFDIIYFYCPCSDPEKEEALEKQIYKTAKPGAYILANAKRSPESVLEKHHIHRVWGRDIWQKAKK